MTPNNMHKLWEEYNPTLEIYEQKHILLKIIKVAHIYDTKLKDKFIKKGKFLQILWHVILLLQNYPAWNTGTMQSLRFYMIVQLKVGSWIVV